MIAAFRSIACRNVRPTLRSPLRSTTVSSRQQPVARSSVARSSRWPALHPPRSIKPEWRRIYTRASQQQQVRNYYRQPFNYTRWNSTSGAFRRWAARPTFYYEIAGIGVAGGAFYVFNLETVPVSGRRRFNVVSDGLEASTANGMYEQTMQEFGDKILPAYSKEHRMVQRVLDRLVPHSGLQDSEWEIHVIDSPEKNAFVIPGGKVFVFSGILETCQGDDGLAAVLGHEIAHNVAHHAAERIQQSWILGVGILLLWFVGIDPGLGQYAATLLLTLPHSRAQESEADYIGLLMMAESCYDPNGAVGLWSRMEKEEQGSPPQFLSTHPSSHNRLGKIRGWLPEAEVKRETGECGTTGDYLNDFKRITDTSRWHDFARS